MDILKAEIARKRKQLEDSNLMVFILFISITQFIKLTIYIRKIKK